MGVYSCKKYTDPKALNDPRLTNPYCNDPEAVNYNWGFPGKVDNSICFYPTDVFQGVYEYHDSITFTSSGQYVYADTFIMTINRHSSTKMAMIGFCSSGDSLLLTAGVGFVASLDTTIGRDDSTVINKGQGLCSVQDTVNGTITKDMINDSILYISFTVYSDTGVVTNHIGTAKLKYRH